MSYFVFCTFDLKNASSKDYENAYADLAMIGLERVMKADDGSKVVIPTTAAMGKFKGENAGRVRDVVTARVKSAFHARRFKSELFVVVGSDWGWGAATT